MWDAFAWESAAQVQHLRTFALSRGARYRDLEPDADLLSPSKSHLVDGYEGWAYCARTSDRSWFLIYLEKGCPRVQLRGAAHDRRYQARWFDPRKGEWLSAFPLASDIFGRIPLPTPPSGEDWGLELAAP